jgi:hypothetical protein
VSEKLDPEALAADLEVLRNRIARIAAAIVDAEIHDRLASLLGPAHKGQSGARRPAFALCDEAARPPHGVAGAETAQTVDLLGGPESIVQCLRIP